MGGIAADDAGGGEAASAALDCTWGACSTGVETVISVGVTTTGAALVTIEGTKVRARERVHRLPFTVVIDSCGVAMQTTGS
jgi:hypothetical protein